MLEPKDLEILENMMESVVKKSEESILKQVDGKLAEQLARQEESILKKVDEKILKSEGLLLDETLRTRNILEKKITKVQQNVDELYKYYRITRLENENISLIVEQLEDLTRRVEILEKGRPRATA